MRQPPIHAGRLATALSIVALLPGCAFVELEERDAIRGSALSGGRSPELERLAKYNTRVLRDNYGAERDATPRADPDAIRPARYHRQRHLRE